jgi:acetoin utilization protein AcuB
MNVGYYMTKNPVVVSPETTVPEAQAVMRREKIHRLPVLDKTNKLIGIVTASDLSHASAAPTTSLDMYELHYLLSKLTVETVMSKNVTTITEELPIEEAARIMADSDISGLPVMRGAILVGIITESDIFRLFISLFGARHAGLRLTVLMPEKLGELAAVSGAIAKAGGNIVSLATFDGEDPTNHYCTMKVGGLDRQTLLDTVSPLVDRIVDVRENI